MENDFIYCHGSPRDPLDEYIFAADVHNAEKMSGCFIPFELAAFVGHTHSAGVHIKDGNLYHYQKAAEVSENWKLDRGTDTEKKYIVNVGSVGQPRDSNRDACYVILEDYTITYRRVRYPVETTANLIRQISELDPHFAARLDAGR